MKVTPLIDDRIGTPKSRLDNRSENNISLTNCHIMQSLKQIHGQFATCIDKVSGSFAFICKHFYFELLLKELDISSSKQSNVLKHANSINGIDESKLESSILNSEVDTEGYDIIRMNHSRMGGRVTGYIRKPLFYNHK